MRITGGSGGDTLDVALIYGPMSYYIYSDTLGGYNYDLFRAISREQNVPMKFWPINSLQEALTRLSKGDFDILASLPRDASYTAKMLFSDPLFLDRQVLVQRRDASGAVNVRSALDLAGDTVHLEADSPIHGRLANLCKEIGDTIYIKDHADLSSEMLILDVQKGVKDYVVANERIAGPVLRKFDNLDASSPISFTQFQCAVFAPGDTALQSRFNTWLNTATQKGVCRALSKKYGLGK